MKKLIIYCLIILPTIAWSQSDEDSTNTYKPLGKERTLELQFTPFGNNPININGVRARWFLTPHATFRMNLFVGVDSDTDITQQADSDLNLRELKDKDFTFVVALRPGMEKHLKGTDRISPYFGWEFDFAYQRSSFNSEFENGNDINYNKTINQNGFVRVGLNVVAGVDCYITKKLYLGTELGFGGSFTKLLAIKIKSDLDGFTEPDPFERGSSLDFGPNVNAQIRLGYAF